MLFKYKSPLELLKNTLDRLHPGVVGLVMHYHGKEAGEKMSALINDINSTIFKNSNLPLMVLDVMLPDFIPSYDDPVSTVEWQWISSNASYRHLKNGEHGVWEFMLNLANFEGSMDKLDDCPEPVKSIILEAISKQYSYILFHQGT